MKAATKTRAPVIRKLPMGENLIISEGGKEAGKKERQERDTVSEASTRPATDTEPADAERQLCCICIGLLSPGMLPCGPGSTDLPAVKGSSSGSGRPPGEGKGCPRQCSYLDNSMYRAA